MNYSEVKRYITRHGAVAPVIKGKQARAAFVEGFNVGRKGDHISAIKLSHLSGDALSAFQMGWKMGYADFGRLPQ